MTIDPTNLGYALPGITATISPAAPIVRAGAIAGNPSSHEIPVKPRSVVDQQKLPCCVSTALGAAMEILYPAWPALGPLFHYYVTRYERGGADNKGLLELRSALNTLTNDGICRHDLHPYPYTEVGAKTKPNSQAYADGLIRALGLRQWLPRYEYVDGVSRAISIQEQLNQNRPVIIGLQLPAGYPDSFLNPNYEWFDTHISLQPGSGHCVLAFGYNDARRAIHIQDSQGRDRFEQGCWWMGYTVVDSPIVKEIYSLIP